MKRYEILGIDVTDDLISVSIECIRERIQDERNPFAITWMSTEKIEYTFKFKCMSELTIMSDYVNVVDLVDVTDTSESTKVWVATHKDMPHLKVSGGSEFEAMLKAYQLMGCVFVDNDWSLEEVEVHRPSPTTLEVNLNTTTNKKEKGNPKMTNKHKHYDMIAAKAANMGLCVFSKTKNSEKWEESSLVAFVVNEHFDFFLCLPQHNENGQCLHWLNGGDIQERGFYNADAFGDITMIGNNCWNVNHIFMDATSEFRIKPKKVKRFIASFHWDRNEHHVTPRSFANIRTLNEYIKIHYGKMDVVQIHEIEVEV